MKDRIIAIFADCKKESLTLPTIKKILGIKKNAKNYEKKNAELHAILDELTASGYIFLDENNHYRKGKRKVTNHNEKEIILNVFANNDALTLNDLLNFTNINSTELVPILKKLELDGKIYYDDYANRYYNMPSNFFIVKVECNKHGRLYYKLDDNVNFLATDQEKGIMPFDKILVKVTPNNDIKIIKIIDRTIKEVLCEVAEKNTIRIVGNNNIPIKATKKELDKLPVGTRLLATLPLELSNGSYHIKINKILGHKNDLDLELAAIATNNGFEAFYSDEELEQIKQMPKYVTEEEINNRIDLTKENIFTIDGSHTKDMDDAVGIRILENGNYELIVSIAHVSHYIGFSSPLWKRAEKNTTSLYLIDGVLHMLNFQISNGICSLNPDVLRLTKSFVMEIDQQGKLVNFDIVDSIIKSRKKMTYEEVNEILENQNVPEGYEPFVNDLIKMNELSQIITNRRIKDGSIDFDSKEIVFELDDNKNIANITAKKSGQAEKLIENFMIMANEAVAEYMLNTGLLFIYRNHEIPFKDKVAETIKIINQIDANCDNTNMDDNKSKKCSKIKLQNLKNLDDPHVIQKIINTLKTKEEFFILSSLILRSMQKAYFSIENRSHFGLALHAYSQVTSPIRRFLDLLIQYILDNINMFYDEKFNMNSWKEYLIKMCERASALERCADKAEYEANLLYMVDYVAARPDWEFDCYVSHVNNNYIVVKTPELIEGIVYLDDIDDGNYKYNADSQFLENKMEHSKIFIGSKLKIKLKNYSREYRTIYFKAKSPNRLKREMLMREKK